MMPSARKTDTGYAPVDFPDGAAPMADPIFDTLERAGKLYHEAHATWERHADDARADAAAARAAERDVREQLQQARALLDVERKRAERHKDRAAKLAAALKDVHKSLFSGNVFEAILRVSLSLTGGTRGVYLTSWDDGRVKVRAAVGVGDYPNKPASEFLKALCDRVKSDGKTFVCNEAAEFAVFPPPADPAEKFESCLVAPAVLLERFNGVVVLADKPNEFDDDDVETVMSVGDGAGVAVQNQNLQNELMQAYFSVVGVLADAMEVKDPYTKGHCQLVARYARRTAEKLAAADEKLKSVCCYGGLLHDVGKIGVSDGVLNKPGKLTPEEWSLMQSHVRIGRDLLAKVPALDGVADVVLHHHERWDGGGYPDGLRAEQISLASRIVCVVDAYSAMTSKRSYKESATADEARAELLKCRGTHFDPAVVDAFLAVLDDPEDADDDCAPDGCGVMPGLGGTDDFRHVVRR